MSAIGAASGAGPGPSIHQPQDDTTTTAAPASTTGAASGHVNAAEADAPKPGQTLAEMARQQPYPVARMTQASVSDVPPPPPQGRPADVDMARMANDVYSRPDAKTGKTGTASEADLAASGWKRADNAQLESLGIDPATLNDAGTGFEAAVYGDGNGRYVVAFAGTDAKSVRDWENNAKQAYGFDAQQYNQAQRLAQTMSDRVGTDKVSFTGHSLGGGLAQVATVATDGYGVTFNAAGLSDGTMRSLDLDPAAVRSEFSSPDRMRAYSVDGDPLTTLNGHKGTPESLGAKYSVPADGEMNPITLHGGGGDGQFYVEGIENGQVKPGEADSLPWHEAREIARRVVDFGGQVVDKAKDIADDVIRAGKDLVDKGIDKGKEIARKAIDGAKDLAAKARDVAERTIDKAKEVVHDTVEKAKDVTRSVADGARDLASEGKKLLDKANPFKWSW